VHPSTTSADTAASISLSPLGVPVRAPARGRRRRTTASPYWNPGDEFYDAERERWRVVRVLDVDPAPPGYVDGVLIVEPACRKEGRPSAEFRCAGARTAARP
jgi:hypothetical protein